MEEEIPLGVIDRFKNAWNVFLNKDPTQDMARYYGNSYYTRPDRVHFTRGNERTIINSVYNRISVDAAQIYLRHVRLDDNERYISEIDSSLNNCLKLEANLDQTARAFIQDVVASMLDEGCVAIIPTDTNISIANNSFDILTMRAAKIVEWYPQNVKVEVYNERDGQKPQLTLPKDKIAIIENPFYAVMNEPNSTLQRYIRKLNQLDVVDDQTSSGKLDLIFQLPFAVKSELQKNRAEERRHSIEDQLSGSKYGIAYIDAAEHVTQLNRPIENNFMKQVEYLTDLLFSQLGITVEILNGTANAETMQNYYTRCIEPIMSAIVDEMKRKFLTPTARTQKQSIMFFRDPFKLVPIANIADIADKFTRNEVLTSNEVRQIVGMKPVDDPRADALLNKNISQSEEVMEEYAPYAKEDQEEIQNGTGTV